MSIALFFISVLLLSCGIESFESLDPPNTPMGLRAYSTNNEIHLSFTAYNPLETFSGYNVYTGYDSTDVRTAKKPLTNQKGIAHPFIKINPFNTVSNIQIRVSGYSFSKPFTAHKLVMIGVAAYDSINNRLSAMSEIVNVEIIGD